MIDAYQLGARVAQTALQFSGACACERYRPRMREALGLSPTEWWDWQKFDSAKHEGISTCFVFASNILHRSGIALPWGGQPWKAGRPIGDLERWARETECWQPYVEGCVPSAGDVVVIGPAGGTHVLVCLDCDGTTLHSVDGGQECYLSRAQGHDGIGRQAISVRERAWGSGVVRGSSVSPVVGWVDVGRAPLDLWHSRAI